MIENWIEIEFLKHFLVRMRPKNPEMIPLPLSRFAFNLFEVDENRLSIRGAATLRPRVWISTWLMLMVCLQNHCLGQFAAGSLAPMNQLAPMDPSWGDPYEMNTSGRPTGLLPASSVTTGVVPAAGVVNAGGGVFVGDSYATNVPPQLNAPLLASPINSPNGRGIFGGGLLGGPVLRGGPLFPQLRNRIDSRLYLRGEYLLWDVEGMDAPPLVTTSPLGTARETAAVLGETGTKTLFGGTEINDGTANGFLISGGFWINQQRTFAIESEYFALEDKDDSYNGNSNGTVILGRPYFDILAGRETAQLVSYPGLVGGSIRVAADSEFRSFLINGRVAMCPSNCSGCMQCGQRDRTDLIIGYRNLRLRDSLSFQERLTSQLANAPGTISLNERFRTTNQFHGLQLGVVHRTLLNRAWLESSIRVALGTNEQKLVVTGNTTFDEAGVVDRLPGGLLAQRTNIGSRTRDEFTMVPELSLRLGVRLSDRLNAILGYSVIYFPGGGSRCRTD